MYTAHVHFLTNLGLFCIDNARVIYRKIRYYKIVKLLKSFKIVIVAPTCFGLHKPSSGSSQPVLRRSYNVDFGYILLYEVIGTVAAYFVQSYYACGS